MDFHYKSHILNGITKKLNRVYLQKLLDSNAKELWNDHENKYNTEEAKNINFFIGKFFCCRVVQIQSENKIGC